MSGAARRAEEHSSGVVGALAAGSWRASEKPAIEAHGRRDLTSSASSAGTRLPRRRDPGQESRHQREGGREQARQ